MEGEDSRKRKDFTSVKENQFIKGVYNLMYYCTLYGILFYRKILISGEYYKP
jgi:hypothetical protein